MTATENRAGLTGESPIYVENSTQRSQ
jgi:hypothetical protein